MFWLRKSCIVYERKKQKIVYGRRPSNINLVVFVRSFGVCLSVLLSLIFPLCNTNDILKIYDAKCYGDHHVKKLFGKMVFDKKEQDRWLQ